MSNDDKSELFDAETKEKYKLDNLNSLDKPQLQSLITDCATELVEMKAEYEELARMYRL